MEQFNYRISGYYFEGMERKHFDEEVKATDNVQATLRSVFQSKVDRISEPCGIHR